MKTKVQFLLTEKGFAPRVYAGGQLDSTYLAVPSIEAAEAFGRLTVSQAGEGPSAVEFRRIRDDHATSVIEANRLIELKLNDLRAALLEFQEREAAKSDLKIVRPRFELLLELTYCQPSECISHKVGDPLTYRALHQRERSSSRIAKIAGDYARMENGDEIYLQKIQHA